jgi:hypothetical protein
MAREDSHIYWYKGGSARLKHPIRGNRKDGIKADTHYTELGNDKYET